MGNHSHQQALEVGSERRVMQPDCPKDARCMVCERLHVADLQRAGCSANVIAAISGHRTLKEVARYTNAADQEKLADTAIRALYGPEREQEERLAIDPQYIEERSIKNATGGEGGIRTHGAVTRITVFEFDDSYAGVCRPVPKRVAGSPILGWQC